jgi:hypothetical protein
MQTNNEIFYHIHKTSGKHDKLWMPGESFKVGNDGRNTFIEYFDTARIGVHYENGPTIPMSEAIRTFRELPIETQREHFPTYLQQAAKAIKEMGTFIRETIFEEIRREEFSSLPSRMKGIWVCEEKDIPYWSDKLHSGDRSIFKVSLTGIMHRANPENLVSDSIEHNLLREHARRYWEANDLENAPVHEMLFVGDVCVHERL